LNVAATPVTRFPPWLVLGFAIIAVAHASIFVRLADAPALSIAAWRLTLATAVVLPIAWILERDALLRIERRTWLPGILAGGLLAGHFATWIASLSYTSISNSVVLVTTAPVWVALIGLATGALSLTRGMWLAVGLSLAGSLVIGWGSARIGSTTLKGDLLAVVGAICFAGYLLLAQRVQRQLAFLPYVVLAYGSAAAWLWIAALVEGAPMAGFDTRTWGALIGIALVSQVIGHSGYNWSLRHLRPDFVAVTLLGEPILASLLGLLFFAEAIPAATLLGGCLVLAAIVMASRSRA
jgi:drug/metabolite transporter (DMT)-like permease